MYVCVCVTMFKLGAKIITIWLIYVVTPIIYTPRTLYVSSVGVAAQVSEKDIFLKSASRIV